jgi:ABC-type sugar transport system substrate-binding protein
MGRRSFLRLAGGAAAAAALGSSLVANAVRAQSPAASSMATAAPGGPKPRIAFGQPHRAGDFYAALIKGAKAEADARGYELLESFADSAADAQVAEINTWIAQGVEAIVVLALDPAAMGPLVERAHEAGTKMISYAFDFPNSDGATLFDDAQGAQVVGEHAGNWIKDKLGGKAKVALLGNDTIETPRLRLDGALAAMQAIVPDIEVVARQDGLLAPEALAATQSLLQAHPDLNVIICAADDGALGASQAVNTAGVATDTFYIAGWDGSKQAMQKVLEGDVIRAVGALDLVEIGKSVVWVPDNVLKGVDPTHYANPYVLVTTDNPEDGERLIEAFG